MSEQEKKRQRTYELLNAETKPKSLCLLHTKLRKRFTKKKKNFFRKKGSWRLNNNKKKKNEKKAFLTALALAIKKDPTTSIGKHCNKLKDLKKTMRIPIKQDLSPDLNPLWLYSMGCFRKQSKCNFPSKYWFT